MRFSLLAIAAAALAGLANVAPSSAQGIIPALNSSTTQNFTQILTLAQLQPAIVNALNSTGPITLFAPTDAAVSKIPADTMKNLLNASVITSVLSYHVVPGVVFRPDPEVPLVFLNTSLFGTKLAPNATQKLIVGRNGTNVTVSYGLGSVNVIESIEVDNGIIHVIDGVLMPPQSLSATASANQNLTALTAAATSAGLAEVVDKLANLTVFAPTNDAFQKAATAFGSTLPPPSLIQSIILFHIINPALYSTDILEAVEAGTNRTFPSALPGQNVTVIVSDEGAISLRGPGNLAPVNVTIPNVLVDSGVVHVIDGVLLPDITKL
ncbi:hypothetical protein HK102_005346, partial [Quaeritorhiza haematococci]